MSNDVYSFKIVLLGEGSVGKTSLAARFVENTFTEKHQATIQASFLQKRINISNQRIELNIWDTAGQERYHALSPIYYRDSHGALLVFDITDNNSFLRLKKWVNELRDLVDPKLPIVIVANKSDLGSRRVVSREEVDSFAKSVISNSNRNFNETSIEITQEFVTSLSFLAQQQKKACESNVLWIETSAKSGRGVENAFLALSYLMLQNVSSEIKEENSMHKSNRSIIGRSGSSRNRSSRRNLVINLENQPVTDSASSLQQHSASSRSGSSKKCCVIQ